MSLFISAKLISGLSDNGYCIVNDAIIYCSSLQKFIVWSDIHFYNNVLRIKVAIVLHEYILKHSSDAFAQQCTFLSEVVSTRTRVHI